MSLSVSGLPSGGQGTFSPSTISGSGSSVLTIRTSTFSSKRPYTLTITGTSGAITSKPTATLIGSIGFNELGFVHAAGHRPALALLAAAGSAAAFYIRFLFAFMYTLLLFAKLGSASQIPGSGVDREEISRNHQKSSRWFQKLLFATYILAIVWTSYTHAAEFKAVQQGDSLPRRSRERNRACTLRRTRRWRCARMCRMRPRPPGVNPHVAEWIVSHESRHHPEATGDGGESRGLWQINKEWHPEVSDACAYNVRCSTGWSLERIRAGYANEWSTWKYCREKFEDCPF